MKSFDAVRGYMSECPVIPMYMFLKENKLETYWDVMMQNGYDDFEYFSNGMEEADVCEMGSNVGMVVGHLSKLVNRWRILRFGNVECTASADGTSIAPEMPDRIKKLLAPSPCSEKIQFFNMVTNDIYNANHTGMTIPALEKYIISQRQI